MFVSDGFSRCRIFKISLQTYFEFTKICIIMIIPLYDFMYAHMHVPDIQHNYMFDFGSMNWVLAFIISRKNMQNKCLI